MNLKNKIEGQLKKAKIVHRFIPLPADLPLDTAAHVQFHGITTQQAIPTMIYRTEKGLIAAQRRADTQINTGKLKELAQVKQLQFASPEDLKILGVEPGVVPLVGLDLPTYVDRKVLEVEQIYGGGGDKLFALTMDAGDLLRATKAKVGDFAGAVEIKRVLSGMRPTGRLHLGNYLGGLKGMLALQDDPSYETLFFTVDLHAITTPYDRHTLRHTAKEMIKDYLAAGLDPRQSAIFVQSDIPETMELFYYFSTVVSMARMQHLPTFKDKVKQHPGNVTMALLNYPILMAADILIYKAGLVPVGIDQEPHLEVAREVARKMNEQYGTDFPEPKRFATKGEYVPSLRGEGKMSKSVEGSFIQLTDDLETIKKRLATAPTDSGQGEKVPTEGGVASLLKFVELFEGEERRREYEQQYLVSGIQYRGLKDELAEAIYKELEPIQKRRTELEKDPVYVDRVIAEGAEKARTIAQETVREVREAMGLS